MELKLRQRIVGAVVLVALAIIFLPLLVKNSNNNATTPKPMTLSAQIPPAPAKPTPAPQTIVMIKNKDLATPDANTNTIANNNNTPGNPAASRVPVIQAGAALPAASTPAANTQQAPINAVKPPVTTSAPASQSTSKTAQLNNASPASAINSATSQHINLVEDETLSPPGANTNLSVTPAKQATSNTTSDKAIHADAKSAAKAHEREKAVTSKHSTLASKESGTETVEKNKSTKKHEHNSHHAKTTVTAKNETATHTKNATSVKSAKSTEPDLLPAITAMSDNSNTKIATPGVAWEVRLGSFANEANVKDLVKQLRAHGFKVYTQSIQSSLGSLTRVAIGPETKRGKADAIQARLASELNIKSEVVPFNPVTDSK